jgi:hypothetical protein
MSIVLSKNFVFAGLVLGISGKQLKSLISRITESGKSESPMETRWMWISWDDDDDWTELLIQVQVYNDAVPASLANTHILSIISRSTGNHNGFRYRRANQCPQNLAYRSEAPCTFTP